MSTNTLKMPGRRMDTKKLVTLSMLAAMAYLLMVIGRVQIVLFLKYEPKDIIITIGGFLYGPLSAFLMSVVVSLLEMITVSDTGLIGLIMNILSTCAFACAAAYVYKKHQSLKGAVIGLLIGLALMTAIMILWNYLITPIYLKIPRSEVVALLVPAILPFNLLKAGLNTAMTMLLYKPVVTVLRKSKLVPHSSSPQASEGGGFKWGATLISALALVTCILFALALKGII